MTDDYSELGELEFTDEVREQVFYILRKILNAELAYKLMKDCDEREIYEALERISLIERSSVEKLQQIYDRTTLTANCLRNFAAVVQNIKDQKSNESQDKEASR